MRMIIIYIYIECRPRYLDNSDFNIDVYLVHLYHRGFGMRQQAVELALKVDPSLARELAQDSTELDERRRLWLMIAKNAASEGVIGGDLDVVSKVVSVLKDCGPDVLSIEDVRIQDTNLNRKEKRTLSFYLSIMYLHSVLLTFYNGGSFTLGSSLSSRLRSN